MSRPVDLNATRTLEVAWPQRIRFRQAHKAGALAGGRIAFACYMTTTGFSRLRRSSDKCGTSVIQALSGKPGSLEPDGQSTRAAFKLFTS